MRTLNKSNIILTVFLLSFVASQPAAQQQNLPFYFDLGPCAEANYCHLVQYNLFPIFIALVQRNRHRTFDQNILYCDKLPYKSEVFRLVSNRDILVRHYNPATMHKLSFDFPVEDKKTCSNYFSQFLAQAYERFNVPYSQNTTRKTTITLIQRYSRCRNILNLRELQRALTSYSSHTNCTFATAQLEKTSFQDQLRLMADTDIFVACHGAAMTNAAFIRKNGIVIEISPYNFSYPFFQSFITNCRPDLTYYRWTLNQSDCMPTVQLGKNKTPDFRYWRDHDIRVNPDRLIEIIVHLSNDARRRL